MTKSLWKNLIWYILLAAWIFFIYRKVHMSWLFIDDLYIWKDYSEMSFREFVFPKLTAYYRPVYWILVWLELKAVGSNIGLIVYINLAVLSITGMVLFDFLCKLSKNVFAAFMVTLMFVTSRFSYYDVSQIIGIMEAAALLTVICMCRCLYDFIHDRKEWRFLLSVLMYILCAFTHERYMVLFPMLVFAVSAAGYLKGEKNHGIDAFINLVLALAAFAFIQFMRIRVTGSIIPAGTGGTEVTETFSKKLFVKNCLSELCYLFGINAGPIHLNGLPWSETPVVLKAVVVLFMAVLVRICMMFFKELKTFTPVKRKDALVTLLFFAGFIIGMITASSVTIRVEMRWIYASFAVCCMILSYMHGVLSDAEPVADGKKNVLMVTILTVLACVLMMTFDMSCRALSKDLYVNEEQNRKESFLEKTYGKYGDDVINMRIYVIGNFYQVSEFEEQNFHRPGALFPEPLSITHVDTVDEIPVEDDDIIVLYEDPEKDTYEYANYREVS
ncbi:MAG: hypothetical protein MJ059_00235 [Lachnospiraceae bacterium]|nr:hypothetical protein [Lachnospiraceae bacterium]